MGKQKSSPPPTAISVRGWKRWAAHWATSYILIMNILCPRWQWSWRREVLNWAAVAALCQVQITMLPPQQDQVVKVWYFCRSEHHSQLDFLWWVEVFNIKSLQEMRWKSGCQMNKLLERWIFCCCWWRTPAATWRTLVSAPISNLFSKIFAFYKILLFFLTRYINK